MRFEFPPSRRSSPHANKRRGSTFSLLLTLLVLVLSWYIVRYFIFAKLVTRSEVSLPLTPTRKQTPVTSSDHSLTPARGVGVSNARLGITLSPRRLQDAPPSVAQPVASPQPIAPPATLRAASTVPTLSIQPSHVQQPQEQQLPPQSLIFKPPPQAQLLPPPQHQLTYGDLTQDMLPLTLTQPSVPAARLAERRNTSVAAGTASNPQPQSQLSPCTPHTLSSSLLQPTTTSPPLPPTTTTRPSPRTSKQS